MIFNGHSGDGWVIELTYVPMCAFLIGRLHFINSLPCCSLQPFVVFIPTLEWMGQQQGSHTRNRGFMGERT